jgi:hypothetical protein
VGRLFDEGEKHIQNLVSMMKAQYQAASHTLGNLQHLVAIDSVGMKEFSPEYLFHLSIRFANRKAAVSLT